MRVCEFGPRAAELKSASTFLFLTALSKPESRRGVLEGDFHQGGTVSSRLLQESILWPFMHSSYLPFCTVCLQRKVKKKNTACALPAQQSGIIYRSHFHSACINLSISLPVLHPSSCHSVSCMSLHGNPNTKAWKGKWKEGFQCKFNEVTTKWSPSCH